MSTIPSAEQPIPADVAEVMNSLGRQIGDIIKIASPGTGFALFTFDLDGPGHISYISNAERTSMMTALKEFIANVELDAAAVAGNG